MQEMGVQMIDPVRHLGGQHQRLAEAADAVGRPVAPKVAQPCGPDPAIGRPSPHGPPGPQHPKRFLMQIFRQVQHGRGNRRVHRVAFAIGRVPQRYDVLAQATRLQCQNLLRDKRLGQARIAF